MSKQVELINRAVKTINSCETLAQLAYAKRYCALIIKKYGNCIKGDFIAEMEQAYKACYFDMELQDLIKDKEFALANNP